MKLIVGVMIAIIIFVWFIAMLLQIIGAETSAFAFIGTSATLGFATIFIGFGVYYFMANNTHLIDKG